MSRLASGSATHSWTPMQSPAVPAGVSSAWAMPRPAVIRLSTAGPGVDLEAEAVVVEHLALEQPRDRLEADVRVGRHVHRLSRREGERAVGVEEAPRSDQAPCAAGQQTPDREAGEVGEAPGSASKVGAAVGSPAHASAVGVGARLLMTSVGDPKAFRERPLGVHPLARRSGIRPGRPGSSPRAGTCASSRSRSSRRRKRTSRSAASDPHARASRGRCISMRRSARSSAPRGGSVSRSKVRAQLAVDARQEVQVEGGGHPDRVVVGREQRSRVSRGPREEQPVAGPGSRAPRAGSRRPPAGRSCRSCRRGTARAVGPSGCAPPRHRGRPSRYSASKPTTLHRVRALRARARPARARRRRCRSGSRRRRAARRAPRGSSASCGALPAAQLGDERGASRRGDLLGVAASRRCAGAGEAVLGQLGRSPRTARSRPRRRGTSTAAPSGRGVRRPARTSAANGRAGCLGIERSAVGTVRAGQPPHAAEARVHVGVVRLEPVAERAPQQAGGGSRRAALEDVVLAVEEVRRSSRDRTGMRSKPGKGETRVEVHSQPLPTRSCTPKALVALRERRRPAPGPSRESRSCRARAVGGAAPHG